MNNEKIQNLRRIISEALTPLIVGDYVLLDVPNHCNTVFKATNTL